jgi:hypothetical protein
MKNIFFQIKLLNVLLLILVFTFLSCNSRHPQKNNTFQSKTSKTKPTLKFYIEDGGSMHGYFTNKVSMLKKDLSKILSISQNVNSLSLSYIRFNKNNNKCIVQKNIAVGEPQIIAKIDSLNEKSFAKDTYGGSGHKSIFETILKNQKKNEIVGFLSDFIPAGEFNNLEGPLNSFIKAQVTKDSTFSICVVKLISRFNGKYYRQNESANGFKLNQLRPYYIWFFGSGSNLKNLKILNYNYLKPLDGFKGISIFTNLKEKIEYSILISSFNENTFSIDRNNKDSKSFKNIIINKNVKKVKFGVAINLSNIIINENYKLDTANYNYPKKTYSLLGIYPINNNEISMGGSVVKIKPSDIRILKNNNATHILLFESINKPTELEFSLIKKTPSWLKESEDKGEKYISNDTNDYNSAIKTFGYQCFNYAIEQNFILDKTKNSSKNYFTGKISVNTTKGSFILKFILFLIILFAIIYFYKRLKNK